MVGKTCSWFICKMIKKKKKQRQRESEREIIMWEKMCISTNVFLTSNYILFKTIWASKNTKSEYNYENRTIQKKINRLMQVLFVLYSTIRE